MGRRSHIRELGSHLLDWVMRLRSLGSEAQELGWNQSRSEMCHADVQVLCHGDVPRDGDTGPQPCWMRSPLLDCCLDGASGAVARMEEP